MDTQQKAATPRATYKVTGFRVWGLRGLGGSRVEGEGLGLGV